MDPVFYCPTRKSGWSFIGLGRWHSSFSPSAEALQRETKSMLAKRPWSPGLLACEESSTTAVVRLPSASSVTTGRIWVTSRFGSPLTGVQTVALSVWLLMDLEERVVGRLPCFGRCLKRLFPREQAQSQQALIHLKARLLKVLLRAGDG